LAVAGPFPRLSGETRVNDTVRAVAWAIAEAWWRKTHRRAAGAIPEASCSEDYANEFWQGFCEEARAAVTVMARRADNVVPGQRVASNRFA
jgi:hypothetical protein